MLFTEALTSVVVEDFFVVVFLTTEMAFAIHASEEVDVGGVSGVKDDGAVFGVVSAPASEVTGDVFGDTDVKESEHAVPLRTHFFEVADLVVLKAVGGVDGVLDGVYVSDCLSEIPGGFEDSFACEIDISSSGTTNGGAGVGDVPFLR